MNSNQNQNIENQEIDMSFVAKKMGNLFHEFRELIFELFRFIIQKIVIIGILFVIGIGIGVYFDKVIKTYDNRVIVVPNFSSYDYLYSKIEFLQSKIEDKDTIFLQKIGIKDPEVFKKIKITPIVDIYQYISNSSERNFDLLKLMAEDGDMKKIIEDKVTSKNYTYHVIEYTTNKKCSNQEILEPLMKYLNQDVFFSKLKKTYNEYNLNKIKEDQAIIAQIDGFLNSFSSQVNSGAKNDKLVYYNENTQLNDVIKTKNDLIVEIGKLKRDLITNDEIIKKISDTSNIKNTHSVNGKLKLILPILFVFLYVLIYGFIKFYKSQSKQLKQQ